MFGLRSWWIGAVGTRLITLHPSIASLATGALAGIATGLATIAWTLRKLEPVTPRGLLVGEQKRHSVKRRVVTGAVRRPAGLHPAGGRLGARC